MPVLDFHLDERSPFDRVHRIAKGATLPELQARILDGSTPVDITGATVTFSMDAEDGTPKVVAQVGAIAGAPADGTVEYAFAAGDVDAEGRFFGQFTVTVGAVAFLVPNNSAVRLRVEIGPAI